MNFGSGGQIIALKSATALILDRYGTLKKERLYWIIDIFEIKSNEQLRDKNLSARRRPN